MVNLARLLLGAVMALVGPGAIGAESTLHFAPPFADLVILNARVHTVDDATPVATAFAVDDGRFVAVGDDALVRVYVGPETDVFDAGGAVIVPGFNDAHLHPRPIFPEDSPLERVDCRPANAPTIDALIEALQKKAAITPKGMLITGRGYEDTKLGRHPTRWDLDRASTEHPIVITHSSGHVSTCNSLAIEMSGITRDTPDPAGGALDRDEQGVPNGVLRESARGLLKTRGEGMRPVMSDEDRVAGLLVCFDAYLAAGITSVGIAGAGMDDLAVYRRVHAERPTVRMYVMLREGNIEELTSAIEREGRGDEWITVGGIKMFHGNSLSGQTCWLSEPYAGRPDYFGIPPDRSQADLDALIARIHDAGLQVCVHANGDREIAMVLDAMEKSLTRAPRPDHRHRIEHGSVMTQPLLERVKRLGVVLAPHSYIWEHGDKMEAYGEQRWGLMHPNGSAVRMGIPACGNSDSPVSEALPMLRIQSMVTRTSAEGKVYGPEQRVSVDDAVRLWTMGSAFASFREQDLGSIAVGKLADFVVLDADPWQAAPDAIRHVEARRTYVHGRLAWPRRE